MAFFVSTPLRFGYHTSQPLTISLDGPRNALRAAPGMLAKTVPGMPDCRHIMAMPPLTWMVWPVT